MSVAVIASYNGAKWLARCIESARASGIDEVIVVDNGSSDESAAIAREGSVEVIQCLPKNTGFGHANNIGIQIAIDRGADYVALVNQDLVAERDTFRMLVDELETNPEVGIVSAMQLNYEGTSVDRLFRAYLPHEYLDDLVLRHVRRLYEVAFVPAAAVVLRSSDLLKVGGFDPLFFLYAEDNDLVDRVRACGLKAAIFPAARVRHWHGLASGPKSLSWQCNYEYSQTVLWLKRYKGPVLKGLLSRIWWATPARSFASRVAWWVGWGRALSRVAEVKRHRDSCPFQFRPCRKRTVGVG